MKLYGMLARAEEKELKQKTNSDWHTMGDRGTAYFHNTIKERRRNAICYWTANEQKKTTILVGGLFEDDASALAETLGIKFVSVPVTYLGVPLIASKLGSDGSVGSDLAGYGGTLRDHTGEVLLAYTEFAWLCVKHVKSNAIVIAKVRAIDVDSTSWDCIVGEVDVALKLFSEMQEKGLVRNVITYTTMILGLSKEGRSDEAFQLNEDMIDEA
ncbi:hypothetical protein IFM89_025919 [Coptis chinensis]|uniref:Pentatricopeptide repeat-containing protein n=1 Tax=Coptis chinensis TaxID=261450 RepID=A0A835HHG4_9MAGN|nr:hypothetical protein IFM89_025919 [Coptis chinensis]